MKCVMLVNTFPEEHYIDSPVSQVIDGESDEDAISRVKEWYGDDCELYIEECEC